MPTPSIGAQRQHFYFQFITHPTADTKGTAILLHFNDKRYLFGAVPEGLSRACIQQGVGLKKLQHIFITAASKSLGVGGLLGLILTLSDVQSDPTHRHGEPRPRLHIYGDRALVHNLAAARRFIFRTGMPLSVHDMSPEEAVSDDPPPTYTDDNIQVWSVALGTPQSSESLGSLSDDSLTDEEHTTSPRGNDLEKLGYAEQQALRKQIVNDMFDSDWRKDRLVESKFRDVNMPATVWLRSLTKKLVSYNCVSHDSAPHIGLDTDVLVRNPWPAALVSELPPAAGFGDPRSRAYIVKGHTQRGEFDRAKAVSLGVKPGPDFGRLTSGASVTLPNGDVVAPEMVLGASRPGKGIAIVHCHQSDMHAAMTMLQGKYGAIMAGVEVICWNVQNWDASPHWIEDKLASFRKFKHIDCLNSSQNDITFDSSAASTVKLARICPQYFRPPQFTHGEHAEDKELSYAERGLTIQVEPKLRIDRPDSDKFTIDGVDQVPESAMALLPSRPNLQSSSAEPAQQSHDGVPEIITLGTGSAAPSKYRNVSATLLRIPNLGNYLFDCGENTFGQLCRMYTEEELFDILKNLRFIWVSHLHADHHLGTNRLIREYNRVQHYNIRSNYSGHEKQKRRQWLSQEKALKIISEADMSAYLSEAYPQRLHIPIVQRPRHGAISYGKPLDYTRADIGVRKLESTYVSHCRGAQAVSVTFDNGFKFSYSGDCRPSASFAQIGLDSDVLVHEATFDDGMEGDARAKKHSTTSEALGVALQMRAKNVVLTHFSQRYQKVPNLSNVKIPEQLLFEEGDALQAASGPVDESADTQVSEVDASLTGPENDQGETTIDSMVQSSSVEDKDLETHKIASDQDNTITNKPEEARTTEMNIAVAFDYMRIKVSEIKDMKLYYPAIEKMFEEQEEAANTEGLTKVQANQIVNSRKVKGGKRKNANESRYSGKTNGSGDGIEKQKPGGASGKQSLTGTNTAEGETSISPGAKRLRLSSDEGNEESVSTEKQ